MKWDLKTPCKNCPFANTPDGIKFAARSRAEEIEEHAYRNGFPCHLSAKHVEADEERGEEGGYVFGENTQHCAGAILMYLKGGYNGNVPFENLPQKKQESIEARLDWKAPVYDSVEAFLDANTHKKRRKA